ncbi:hypothetical protein Bca4012_059865 [Brassica carinata]
MASKAISIFLLSLVLLYAPMANIPTAEAQSFMFDPCKISEECEAANCASGEALCIRKQCHCISSSSHLAKLNKLNDLKPCKVKSDI